MKRAFANFQPDLNLRNPLVLDELVDILDFWMDLGIWGVSGTDRNKTKAPIVLRRKLR